MLIESLVLTGLSAIGLAQGSYSLADGPPTAPAPAATAPATTPARGDEATAPHNASSPPATEAAPAAAAEPAEPKKDEAGDEKRLYAAGYRPEIQNGVQMWCRRELTLGSRLASQKNCGTIQSLAQSMRQNQHQIDDAQRKTGFYPVNTKTP